MFIFAEWTPVKQQLLFFVICFLTVSIKMLVNTAQEHFGRNYVFSVFLTTDWPNLWLNKLTSATIDWVVNPSRLTRFQNEFKCMQFTNKYY